MKGREYSEGQPLGDFLQKYPGGVLLLRGKFAGQYLHSVPRGYVRKYILVNWIDDMTPRELELFTLHGQKEEPDG